MQDISAASGELLGRAGGAAVRKVKGDGTMGSFLNATIRVRRQRLSFLGQY
jgi:hypothetical protein